MGSRAHTQLDEPVSRSVDPLGEKGRKLSGPAPSCLRLDYLPCCGPIGIGSKPPVVLPAGSTHAITEFPLPPQPSLLVAITKGPDGNLWFTEQNPFSSDEIGRITPSGTITEFPLPTPQSGLDGITTGPDGNLWFAEWARDTIGRMSPAGDIAEFRLPKTGGHPVDITAGPDGNLWFTEGDGNAIWRMSPAGIITEFPLPSLQSGAGSITAGPDGNLWFTESGRDTIGRMSPAGIITEFSLPSLPTAKRDLVSITAGPDGNLWFAESPAPGCAGYLAHPFTKSIVFHERMCQVAGTRSQCFLNHLPHSISPLTT